MIGATVDDGLVMKSFFDSDNYILVTTGESGGRTFVIKSGGVEVSEQKAGELVEAMAEAAELAEEVLGTDGISDYGQQIEMRITKDNGVGLMNTGFEVDASVLNLSKDSIKAAALHEFIENWREQRGFPNGGMEDQQMLAEFLFCGEDRNIFEKYTLGMYEDDQGEYHKAGWIRMLSVLLPTGEGGEIDMVPESIWEKVKAKKASMTEAEKIEMIKSVVLPKEN